jgi:predicted small metal-binding protein
MVRGRRGGDMKDFHCRDAGMNCDYVARGETNEEILRKAGEHAREAHQMTVSPDLARKVESMIHDEGSDACRRSAGRS